MSIDVVRDLGSLEILLKLLLKLKGLLLLANCWRANKIWLASDVERVFSLRNCGWLVEHAFFCFPEKFPGGNKEFLLELLSPCEKPRLGLNQFNCRMDRLRIPLQDGNNSGNDHQLFPGFLRVCSGIFPERFLSMSVPVGSREFRLV